MKCPRLGPTEEVEEAHGLLLPVSVLLSCWAFLDLEQLILVLHRVGCISVVWHLAVAFLWLPAVSTRALRAQPPSHSSAISSTQGWSSSSFLPPPPSIVVLIKVSVFCTSAYVGFSCVRFVPSLWHWEDALWSHSPGCWSHALHQSQLAVDLHEAHPGCAPLSASFLLCYAVFDGFI